MLMSVSKSISHVFLDLATFYWSRPSHLVPHLDGLASQLALPHSTSHIEIRFHACSAFYKGAGNLNSGPHACATSALPVIHLFGLTEALILQLGGNFRTFFWLQDGGMRISLDVGDKLSQSFTQGQVDSQTDWSRSRIIPLYLGKTAVHVSCSERNGQLKRQAVNAMECHEIRVG